MGNKLYDARMRRVARYQKNIFDNNMVDFGARHARISLDILEIDLLFNFEVASKKLKEGR